MYKPYIFSTKNFPNNNPQHFLKALTLESIASSRPHAIFFFFFLGNEDFSLMYFLFFPFSLKQDKSDSLSTKITEQLARMFVLSCSVVTLWDPWTVARRLLCPRDFPGKGPGVIYHFLLHTGHYIYESRLSCIIYHKESLQIIHCLMLANPL